MSFKILVADDSLTVQKVIKMTLSDSDFELSQAYCESELLEHIQRDKFDLVLLDFSLGEKRDAYELSRLIKEDLPEAKVLVMLGAFDILRDNLLAQSEIDDQITKPFESDLMIEKCQGLLEGKLKKASDEDWVVESSPLEEEMHGWGMEIPAPMSGVSAGESALMPEPIEESDDYGEGPSLFPKEEDLEYPLLDDKDAPGDDESPLKAPRSDHLWETDLTFKEMSADHDKGQAHQFDENQIVEKVKEAIVPVLEEMIKKYASEKVEKVAWEVIPDLAENLISEEIQNLSNEVLKQN